jgi:glycerophosphoryl diester phosphodiesterase
VLARPALGLLLAVTTVLATGSLTAMPAQASTSCVPPPVAHRGDSERAPENTLPAFRKAFALGVRRIELDVRFSLSDVPVLMHDRTVGRTTNGTGTVSGLSLAQLRELDAGSWFSRDYRGTHVPTLYEALKLAEANGASTMVELKTVPTPHQMALLLERIRWLSHPARVLVTSFSEDAITAVRAAAPDIRTAIIDWPHYRSPESVLQYGSTYVVNHESLTSARSASWRSAGIELRPWTVDTVSGWRRMAYDKASATLTNRPAAYLAWARQRCS